jgi:hypothetical protein
VDLTTDQETLAPKLAAKMDHAQEHFQALSTISMNHSSGQLMDSTRTEDTAHFPISIGKAKPAASHSQLLEPQGAQSAKTRKRASDSKHIWAVNLLSVGSDSFRTF